MVRGEEPPQEEVAEAEEEVERERLRTGEVFLAMRVILRSIGQKVQRSRGAERR